MISSIQYYFDHYSQSHKNPTNKLIHWICVPSIVLSLLGLLYLIPFPLDKTWLINWASVVFMVSMIFYVRHSISIALGFLLVSFIMLKSIAFIVESSQDESIALIVFLAIFVIAWIGQFVGHKIEGKKPSFLDDLKYLMIGPAWLIHFIYKKLGIPY